MKTFLKYMLATIVGVLVVQLLALLLFFGIMAGVASSFGKSEVTVKDHSVLRLKLNGNIPDRVSDNPFDKLDFLSKSISEESVGLNDILKSIDKARRDDRIQGIYLDLTDIESNFGGLATAVEIRDALKAFKEDGKFVYAYSNLGYSQKAYFLATVADSLFVNPETPLLLTGMGGTSFFYKELLDKIGVKAEIVKVGKYKSAVEPFTQTEMSAPNREQVLTYLRSLWGHVLGGVSESRHISVDSLNGLADAAEFRTPESDMSIGLFDGVCYEDAMLDALKERCGIELDKKLNVIDIEDYKDAVLPDDTPSAKEKVAVVYASGEIGETQSATAIGPGLVETLRKVAKDKNVKAIVMRVNSPGGSALVSDIIWREVCLARAKKPFIVSMGNVAASGGYYISCAADTIVADPTTLTGSIGIYGMFFTGEKLIREKLGITSSSVTTNAHSDFGGGYPFGLPVANRSLTDYERGVLQKYIEKGYETFLTRVADGRGMTRDAVHEIAQGRVWTGSDALKIGLVDVLGGLETAIGIAADKAGLENYRVAEYPVEKDFLSGMLSNLSASAKSWAMQLDWGEAYEPVRRLRSLAHTPQGMVARIPYDMVIE